MIANPGFCSGTNQVAGSFCLKYFSISISRKYLRSNELVKFLAEIGKIYNFDFNIFCSDWQIDEIDKKLFEFII